jgi:M6 family metalloprotease-like protein
MSPIRNHCLTGVALLSAFLMFALAPPARALMPPLSGVAPPEILQASEQGLLAIPSAGTGLPSSTTQSTWRVPVILVSFSDSLLTHTPGEFNRALFDTTRSTATGSAYDYYRWVSNGRFTLVGEVVATVHLSQDRLWYGNNSYGFSRESPNNDFGLVWEALQFIERDQNVNWSDYDLDHDGFVDMLWVVHAGIGGETSQDRNNLWSVTTSLTSGWRGGTFFTTQDPVPGSSTQNMRVDRFTILPELSSLRPGTISEIGVYCHEFGHALGLPDLYTVALFTGQIDQGPGCWSLMSTGAYGANGRSPEYPAHMGAWPLQFLGWDHTFRPAQDSTVTLDPLEGGGPIMDLWYQGEAEPEHFLIENRQRLSFDRNLLGEGLIVYHVDDAIIFQRLRLNSINSGGTPGLRVVEADGDEDLVTSRNAGDANDPFPGALNRVRFDDDTSPSARSFVGARTNVALEDIHQVDRRMRFRARVEGAGWLPPVDCTVGSFAPVESHSLARSAGVDDQGIAYWVSSEERDDGLQIYLRSGRGQWGPPERVTASPGSPVDPAIAVLPGGDLAIVWIDDRSGRSEIWFRSRIRGVWTPERLLLGLPGQCRAPALGADARGGLSLAFLYLSAGAPELRFMRFTWFSPFGQTMRVTTPDQRPGVPALAVAPNGVSFIVWSEWSSSPQKLCFARCHPDSGVAGNYTLTFRSTVAQLDPSAVTDRFGTLHVVWQSSGPGNNQIHFQRRLSTGFSPVDTILDAKGYLLQNPTIAIDTARTLHVAYESFRTGSGELRYLRSKLGDSWDAVSTRLTNPLDGVATKPQVLPSSKSDLTIAYIHYASNGPRVLTRRRLLEPGAASVTPRPRETVLLRAGPNPLRPGQAVRLWCAGRPLGDPAIELFDVAGRRLTRIPLVPSEPGWQGELSAETTRAWPAGIVFARGSGFASELRLVVIR